MNDAMREDEVDKVFRWYRTIVSSLLSIIITLTTAILGAFWSKNVSLQGFDMTGSFLLRASGVILFIAMVGSLISVYLLFEAYYRQANKSVQQDRGNYNGLFATADWLIRISFFVFLVGLVLGAVVIGLKH